MMCQSFRTTCCEPLKCLLGLNCGPKSHKVVIFFLSSFCDCDLVFKLSFDSQQWISATDATNQPQAGTLSPKSHVKRWFFNLPPNSRGLKTARFWPQISSTPNVIFSSSELPSNSVNSEVSYSVNHFWKFHHFLYYNKGWSRPILNGLWAGPRG